MGKLTDDLSIWKQIAARFLIDLFCGLFMQKGKEGPSLAANVMAMLGERGIELGQDIYSGDKEGQDA